MPGGTLERPNSGGRPLSVVGIRTLPPGLVESSHPRRLRCGSRNDPQLVVNGRRRDDPCVLLDQANRERGEVVVGRFERSLDELFDQGAREGARRVLGQLATRGFGEEFIERVRAA